MSKGSWNAQRGCFENVVHKGDTSSSSVREQDMPTSVGTLDTVNGPGMGTIPTPSPVDIPTIYSRSRDFCASIGQMESLMRMISVQLSVLSTCARELEPVSLGTLSEMRKELAQMSLDLASMICNASLNSKAQTGSAKPVSHNYSPIDSVLKD